MKTASAKLINEKLDKVYTIKRAVSTALLTFLIKILLQPVEKAINLIFFTFCIFYFYDIA